MNFIVINAYLINLFLADWYDLSNLHMKKFFFRSKICYLFTLNQVETEVPGSPIFIMKCLEK